MKYFLDTEFIEGTQSTFFGKTKPTIDLISIGIVAEDEREYYAISKDFNLKEAWNRYDIKTRYDAGGHTFQYKEYWIRNNVLEPIFLKLATENNNEFVSYLCNYKLLKKLINKYGKSNEQIAKEIIKFTNLPKGYELENIEKEKRKGVNANLKGFKKEHIDWASIEFYGYYSDYDWVTFCWLFGRMIDLPKGFPMYCIDLKQTLDEKAYRMTWNTIDTKKQKQIDMQQWINDIKNHPDYPRQINEHNALEDARWNKQLYEFLIKL